MFARQHSLPLYFAFACVWFWGCIALGYIQTFHFWVPLVGALAPALSALVVTSMAEGEPAVRELGRSLPKVARRLAMVPCGVRSSDRRRPDGGRGGVGVRRVQAHAH